MNLPAVHEQALSYHNESPQISFVLAPSRIFDIVKAHEVGLGSSITNGFVKSTLQALPAYINDYAKPVVPVTAEHIVIGPGLGSLIAQFMWAVCDEGDGVLLATVSK